MRWAALAFVALVGSTQVVHAQAVPEQGEITVACTQSALEVMFDGNPWFTCPDTKSRYVGLGTYQVEGRLAGYMPQSVQIDITEKKAVLVNLEAPPVAYRVSHRFPTWLPWSLGGSGAVLLVGGAALGFAAADKMRDYDQRVAIECAVTGCDGEKLARLDEIADSARRMSTISRIGLAIGGLGLVSGVVLYFLNDEVRTRVEVTPAAGGVAAQAAWRF